MTVATAPRDRRRLVVRTAIVDAARSILRTEGARALTMRRIADAVDYSPASLYAHFESREALLGELCGDGFARLRAALETAAEGSREPRERLVALAHGYVRFALEHAETYRLIFMEDAELTKGVFASTAFEDGDRAFAMIVAPLHELKARKKIRASVDPLQLADLFWVIVHGIASARLSCPAMPATPDATLIGVAVATLLDGSAPAKRGAETERR